MRPLSPQENTEINLIPKTPELTPETPPEVCLLQKLIRVDPTRVEPIQPRTSPDKFAL